MNKYLLSISILFFLTNFYCYAQNLPQTQQKSLRIPGDMKVDGKAIELRNQFQAYNSATDIYYTLANDESKLYLSIQAKNLDVIKKIILGGVTLAIHTSGKKDDKEAVAITFPVNEDNYGRTFINMANKPEKTKDTLKDKMVIDSFINVINKQLAEKSKMIKVVGVKQLSDSLISVYNEEGIKATALFDNNIYYTYELAIPLKYLSLSVSLPKKFYYNIKLNGATANNATIQVSGKGRFLIVSGGNRPDYAIPLSPQTKAYAYPTDFWGEYILIK